MNYFFTRRTISLAIAVASGIMWLQMVRAMSMHLIQHTATEDLCKCGQPVKPNRKSCAVCLAKAVEVNRRRGDRFLAKGLCRLCGKPKRPDKTICDYHLEMMRKRGVVRNKERASAGLCRQCGKLSELGQTLCLVHRKVKSEASRHRGLPNPVLRALREHREAAQALEREKRLQERIGPQREFIERNMYLIADERAREILARRYGQRQTLEGVGNVLGISRERVRQIQAKAEEQIFMFTIEKDIPIPPPSSREAGGEIRSMLEAMNIGESFVMPLKHRLKANNIARRMNWLIATRKISDTEVRVWLVSKSLNGDQCNQDSLD